VVRQHVFLWVHVVDNDEVGPRVELGLEVVAALVLAEVACHQVVGKRGTEGVQMGQDEAVVAFLVLEVGSEHD